MRYESFNASQGWSTDPFHAIASNGELESSKAARMTDGHDAALFDNRTPSNSPIPPPFAPSGFNNFYGVIDPALTTMPGPSTNVSTAYAYPNRATYHSSMTFPLQNDYIQTQHQGAGHTQLTPSVATYATRNAPTQLIGSTSAYPTFSADAATTSEAGLDIQPIRRQTMTPSQVDENNVP